MPIRSGVVWFDVRDLVPKDDREVLVVTKSKNGIRNIDKGYYMPEVDRWAHRGTAEVTHWAHLPSLPREKETKT